MDDYGAMTLPRFVSRLFVMIFLAGPGLWLGNAADVKAIQDIVLAEVDGHPLLVDIFVPESVENPPLVMFIHGGGWVNGSRKGNGFWWLAKEGYAVASISYRLTDVASHPAQIHDCKGAVRWLRASAGHYGYDASKIVVGGTSAGGHLAALLGVSGGVKALEGNVGGNLDVSSQIAGIVDFYGATDFIQRSKTQPEKTEEPDGIVYKLLGGPALGNKRIARQASAAFHVDENDPPLLVVHGRKDPQVLIGQSERIVRVYKKNGLDVEFHVVEEGGHGGEGFDSPDIRGAVLSFLEKIYQ